METAKANGLWDGMFRDKSEVLALRGKCGKWVCVSQVKNESVLFEARYPFRFV